MTAEWRRCLLAGVCFGLGGAACGIDVSAGATGEGYQSFAVFAGASGLLVGTLAWWYLVARRPRATWGRGALVGALVGVVAHPVCWYLFTLWNWFEVTTGRQPESVAGPPLGPLTGLLAAFPFSAMSLLLIGWLTTHSPPRSAPAARRWLDGRVAATQDRLELGPAAPRSWSAHVVACSEFQHIGASTSHLE